MKNLKIFIASSSELKNERMLIELEIGKLNTALIKKKIFLEPVLWEELRLHFNGARIQNYFNQEMLACDVVIFLFWKKAGDFTLEEFNTAYGNFQQKGRIKYIYVYFKDTALKISEFQEGISKIAEMKSAIQKYEQIYNVFESDAQLIQSVNEQLRFITEELKVRKPVPANEKNGKNKLIIFDLDGTLLQGIVFSWDLIWEKLNFSEEYRKYGKIKYIEGKFSLQEWCEWAVNEFREKQLSKKQIIQMINANVTVMKNLKRTIEELRKKGFYTAIISGGMDIFLHTKIPGYKELFDDVFINAIKFDEEGIIQGCVATKYDFSGKHKGLKYLCKKYKIRLKKENVIFVGDNFNDEDILNNKNVKFIAVNPNSAKLQNHVADIIKGDDISKVLKFV